jgi:hypothetical protein
MTRVGILSHGFVAIVEARARSAQRMQANAPALAQMLQSLRVVPAAAGDRLGRAVPTPDASAPSARPEVDPLVLQTRAARRLGDFVDYFRRTGDFQTRQQDLTQADVEFGTSNQALAARGDWSALATGLIK